MRAFAWKVCQDICILLFVNNLWCQYTSLAHKMNCVKSLALWKCARNEAMLPRACPRCTKKMKMKKKMVTWLNAHWLGMSEVGPDNHDGNENVDKQKVLWAKQWLCTCVMILCTFLCRPLQNNNVKWRSSSSSSERGGRRLIFRISIWNKRRCCTFSLNTFLEPLAYRTETDNANLACKI